MMKRSVMALAVSLTLALLPSWSIFAQKCTISGHMTDSASGESLISAAVINRLNAAGAVTNNFGYYTLTLPAGDVALDYSYIGYEGVSMEFSLTRDTVINVAFKPVNEFISGATVTATQSETGVRGTQMSAIEVPVNLIRSMPAIGGEVDVIKALQLLPGVQSGTEGSAGMYVRGGGPDENLLLLDGVPLYNVNHMGGFFSVFDADAIKNVTLYKGSFPARFGSRLSSVVDVRLKDGNDREFHGSGSIGLLSAKFNLEGPIVKGRTTFNVSARRTYYDILAQPVIRYIVRRESDNSEKLKATAGYYFYDINAKVTHKISNRDRLFFSYYMGDDKVYADIHDKYVNTYDYNMDIGADGVPVHIKMHTESEEGDDMKLNWNWGNIVGAARWNHVFSPKLFMNLTANYTQYRHDLGLDSFTWSKTVTTRDRISSFSDTTSAILGYRSLINDISAGTDFEYHPSPAHDIKFGLNYTHHMFKPSISSISTSEKSTESGQHFSASRDTVFGDRNMLTDECAAYFEDNWSITPFLKLNAGLRYSLYSVTAKTYHSLEPRISMRFLVNDDLSFKVAYTEMSQYIHLLSNSNISLPTDLWVPVTASIEPMRSHQAAAGAFYSWNTFDFSVEGYYKTMDNILEYRDGASFLGSATGWEQKVACGRGWSYGVEFLVQRKVGKTTGWLGYTWSKSMRQFDREGNVINFGNPFPAKYDRRHDLSIVVNHKFSDRFDISGTFVYGTGVCGSLALQYVYAPAGDLDGAGLFDYFTSTSLLESRNNYRLPDYHRADIGANFHKKLKRCERIISVSAYNVYNRQNPFIVYPGYETETKVNPDGGVSASSYPVLKQLSIFPIMPSISWTYKF